LLKVLDAFAMMSNNTQFEGVTALAKANVYFDGKVVSHSLLFPDGSKKTLGLIYAGSFHFGTDKAESRQRDLRVHLLVPGLRGGSLLNNVTIARGPTRATPPPPRS
jgi:hypothetical protein